MPGKSARGPGEEDLGQPVPVVYASSLVEAEWYCQLLDDHDIPAVPDEDYTGPRPKETLGPRTGVAVLVPESLLEESREIIADMEDLELFEDEDEDLEDEDEDLQIGFELEGEGEDEK